MSWQLIKKIMESTRKDKIKLFDEKTILDENNVKIVVKDVKKKIKKTKENGEKKLY